MTKTIEIPDIAMCEETDSELAKYTIQQLLKTYDDLEEQYKSLMKQIIEQNKRIDKAIEYITSYESIEEIQHCERIEDNKELDYKTMVEMNRRYLIVHDKLLDILRGEDSE